MSVEAASFRQILAGTEYTLSCGFYEGSDPVDPGTVTIDITDSDGTAIVSDGATGGTGTDARTYALTPAQTASPTLLTAVWTSAGDGDLAASTALTTYAEVRGDLLFTLHEAREWQVDPNRKLSDRDKFPDVVIEAVRFRISEMFDDIVTAALGRKYERVILSGDGSRSLLLPLDRVTLRGAPVALRSAAYREYGATAWTTYTETEISDMLIEHGVVYRESLGTWPRGRQNVRIGYEHGYRSVPLELREIALRMAAIMAIPSDIDPRAMSFSDGINTIRYVTPGLTRNAFTSVPDANEVLNRYRGENRVPRVG